MPASRCGFPMNFIIAVARDVFAQLLKFPAFAELPLGVQSERAAMEELGRQMASLGEQIRIDAEFRAHRYGLADAPESER